MTNQEKIWREFSTLPADAQQQVADLIAFLNARLEPDAPTNGTQSDLKSGAFFGMWRDREDLADSTWVRRSREREWTEHR